MSRATDQESATALLRPPRITGRPKAAGLAVQGERSESRSDTEGALDRQNGDLTIDSAGEDEAPDHGLSGGSTMEQLLLPGSEQREIETPDHQRWLTVPDVMRVLGVGRDKVYDLIRSGDLFSVKVGRYRRFPPGCMEEYLARLREDAA